MAWVRQLLDWQQETEDPGEFLESLRFEINSAEVYVFTPRGDVIALPTGSTPVDFAYAIHTEVGHHTIGARVNGRLVPLESTLDNGDVVEVFTSKAPNAGPSRDWLGFVKSPRARNKIRQWFTKERREEAIEQGKDQIARLMRKEGLPLKRVITHESLTHGRRPSCGWPTSPRSTPRSARATSAPRPSYAGSSTCSAATTGAAEDLAEAVTITTDRAGRGRRGGDAGRDRQGRLRRAGSSSPSAARPVPGDEILGFVTRGAGVSVHRARLHQRRAACTPSPSGSSRWSGRRPRSRCSW